MSIDLSEMSIVYIAESIQSYGKIDLYNCELEQESAENTSYILNKLKKIFNKVYYYSTPAEFSDNYKKHKNHLIFPNWYGKNSRSRLAILPGFCEMHGLKYIGADAYVNSLGNDKYLSQLYAQSFGINVPKSIVIFDIHNQDSFNCIKSLKLPIIVKPNYSGNSIGIGKNNICYDYQQAINLIVDLYKNINEPLIVQEYIQGEEVEIFIFGNDKNIMIFEAFQNVINGVKYFKTEILDFNSKFILNDYDEISYSNVSENLKSKISNLFKSLGKAEFIRFDFRVNSEDAYLIELSVDCYIGPGGIPSKSFIKHGMDYEEMLRAFSLNALKWYDK